MAAPVNISFALATDLGALPADITQTDINDAGVNFTVFYKFTAPLTSKVIGAWAFSGNIGAGYRPTIRPYDNVFNQILSIAAQNKPIQFPVNELQVYYLEVTKNTDTAGPEDVRIRVEVAPNNPVKLGDIAVNDDTNGFPLAILAGDVDHTARRFIKDIVAGEAGDILHVGDRVLLFDGYIGNNYVVYDWNFTEIARIPVSVEGEARIRANQTLGKFFIGEHGNVVGPVNAKWRSVTLAGVVSAAVELPSWGLAALCSNNAETILYYNRIVSDPIKRWDITNGVALSDLVAGVANYVVMDILVLDDDTIVVGYYRSSTKDINIIRYDAAGATLNTYAIGLQTGLTLPRLAYALDDPNSFWLWLHISTMSEFRNIKVSDGSTITARFQTEYEGGAYNTTETATPTSRFGNSYSCPFVIMPLPSPSGILVIVPDKRMDTNGLTSVIIPAPTFRTGLLP